MRGRPSSARRIDGGRRDRRAGGRPDRAAPAPAAPAAASDSINVLMVNNPQMVDIQKLTADNFTKQTGIKVNYTVLPENDVRDKISQELSSQAGIYDVSTISNYEVPFYAKAGWLAPLSGYVAADSSFDQADIFPGMTKSLTASDGKLYAEPFYGESSFLMYRKDVFAAKGLTMPAKPTWQQVADLAAKVDNAQPGMRGICLRGQVGWGQIFAPLTTVVNTFGGTWFDKDWNAQVNSPPFTDAVNFYVNLVRSARRGRRAAGRLHRVPEQPGAGQGRDVVRRHLGRRLAGGQGLTGGRQARLRRRPRWTRPRTPAGSTPGRGRSSTPARRRTRPGSSSPGPRPRTTRTWSAPSSAGPTCRPASGCPPTTTRSTSRRPRPSPRRPRPPSWPPTRQNPGVQPRPVRRHPVHGLPRVQRAGDHGVAVRQHRHRRRHDGQEGLGRRPDR